MRPSKANARVVWVFFLRQSEFDSRFHRFVGTITRWEPASKVFSISPDESTRNHPELEILELPADTKIRKAMSILAAIFQGPVEYFAVRFGFSRWKRTLENLELPSVIVTLDVEALAIAHKFRDSSPSKSTVSILADLHEYYPEENSTSGLKAAIKRVIMRRLLAKTLKSTELVSCVGDDLALKIQKEFSVEPVVIPNFPMLHKRRARSTGNPIRLVYHGYFDVVRGYDTLLEAFIQSRQAHELNLVVAPSQLDEVASFVSGFDGLSKNVNLHPFVPPSQLVDFLSDFDVEIIPTAPTSLNRAVLLPNKLFEAIGAGLAVVSTPLPNVARVLDAWECGVVTRGFEIEDLRLAIDSLTAEEVDRMRRNSDKAAGSLNWEANEAAIISVLDGLSAR